jgi:hypothetical protein
MAIKTFLQDNLKLRLKDSIQLQPVRSGVNFLGFRVFPYNVLLSRSSRIRFAQKMQAYERLYEQGLWDEQTLAQHSLSLVGFTLIADAKGFRNKVLSKLPSLS